MNENSPGSTMPLPHELSARADPMTAAIKAAISSGQNALPEIRARANLRPPNILINILQMAF